MAFLQEEDSFLDDYIQNVLLSAKFDLITDNHSEDFNENKKYGNSLKSDRNLESFVMIDAGDIEIEMNNQRQKVLKEEKMGAKHKIISPEKRFQSKKKPVSVNKLSPIPSITIEPCNSETEGDKNVVIEKAKSEELITSENVNEYTSFKNDKRMKSHFLDSYEADTESLEEADVKPKLRLSSSLTNLFEQEPNFNRNSIGLDLHTANQNFRNDTQVIFGKNAQNNNEVSSDTEALNSLKSRKEVRFSMKTEDVETGNYFDLKSVTSSDVSDVMLKDQTENSDSDELSPSNPFSPKYLETQHWINTYKVATGEEEIKEEKNETSNSNNEELQVVKRDDNMKVENESMDLNEQVKCLRDQVNKMERVYKKIIEALKRKSKSDQSASKSEKEKLINKIRDVIKERNKIQDMAERRERESAMIQSRMREEITALSNDFTAIVSTKLQADGTLQSRVARQLLKAQQERDRYFISVLERQDKINEMALLIRSQQLDIRDLEDQLFCARTSANLHESDSDTSSSGFSDILECDQGRFLPHTSSHGDTCALDLFGYSGAFGGESVSSDNCSSCSTDLINDDVTTCRAFNPLKLKFIQKQIEKARNINCELNECQRSLAE